MTPASIEVRCVADGVRVGRDDRQVRRQRVFRLFKKVWMPLLLVVVIALGMYAVVRIRDMFGANAAVAAAEVNADTKPFNPPLTPNTSLTR
jgi:hypothetical protein